MPIATMSPLSQLASVSIGKVRPIPLRSLATAVLLQALQLIHQKLQFVAKRHDRCLEIVTLDQYKIWPQLIVASIRSTIYV
jgi:hypothetical protein